MPSKLALMCGLLVAFVQQAAANEYEDLLNEIVAGPIAVVVSRDRVREAIVRQNEQTAHYSQKDILALDEQWRAELKAAQRPLISSVLDREVSEYLKTIQGNSGGAITEIIITDATGLNVAQSKVTSDYWQGDEPKWQVPFQSGRINVGGIALDESTQEIQTQISVPVRDARNNIIGTATFAVRVDPD